MFGANGFKRGAILRAGALGRGLLDVDADSFFVSGFCPTFGWLSLSPARRGKVISQGDGV